MDSMRTIAVMNQKGGVGKTTTSVNLAAGLAKAGRRVCLIDLDPQGHASIHLGVEAYGDVATIYQVFAGEKTMSQARRMVAGNLWVVPANIDLAATEMELAHVENRELILRTVLDDFLRVEPYDYVIIDCPPSLGVLTVNALSAVREMFIPLQPHFFALQGLSKLLETTAVITRRLNRGLRVTGIILCLYETGTRLAADITEDLTAFLEKSGPETPWSGATIFKSRVRRNIKLAEAPSFGQSIFDYAPQCPGATDYTALVGEVTSAEQSQSTGNRQVA
jgi:chromosome partitioning protein